MPNFASQPAVEEVVNVIASATLARGSVARGTLDLTDAVGAFLYIRVGRTGNTALGDPVVVSYSPMAAGRHPNGPQLSGTVAASVGTTVDTDSGDGQNELMVDSSASFAAGDTILIGAGTAREEWARVSKTESGILHLVHPLLFTHTAAQGDTVRNRADVFPRIFVGPGDVWEVVVDYGKAASGDSVVVEVVAKVYREVLTAQVLS